jgi:HEAT repeat protein
VKPGAVTRLNVARALEAVRSGKPDDAFEGAKWLSGQQQHARARDLMEIAEDKSCAILNRVAAIHTIGFLRRRPSIAPRLMVLLADSQEHTRIRGQAAESLGCYRERAAIPLLRKILLSNERPGLKVECIFALSKMWAWNGDLKTFNPDARKALNKFARTQPAGKAGRELKRSMRAIRLGWV